MQNKENKLIIAIIIIVALGLLYLLSPILTPFLTGALLAYLADPLVQNLMRLRFSRLISSIIVFLCVFLILFLLILLLIPLIENQIAILVDVIPNSIAWVQDTIVPWLKETFGVSEAVINVVSLKKILTENLSKAGGAADWILKTVFASGIKIIEIVINLILIPVVMFYLLCDWNKFIMGIRNLIPRNAEPTVVKLSKECDEVLGAFFRGQFLVMLALGVVYSAGLTLIGLQVGVIIGLISGVLSIVPYLGFIVGIIIASIAAFVQFNTVSAVLLVCLVYAIGHLLEHMVLAPKLVGDRIGLHPVAVIFSILAGGYLFGFIGILLALPVASVVMVWVRYLHKRYQHSDMYQQS
jgi:predicted PurR-regulated permease PerM